VHGRADDVLDACDRAVELADDDMRGFFADSRGVGRWAVGDTAGAVADFETFLGWASGREPMADLAATRRRWIDALRSGADPLEGSSLPAHGNELAPFRMELGLVWQWVTIE
ncbi:MAG TPA: hypothetical protein VE173_01720, partial [Longimicrobiales bacterium]|nr:hypothetical protein [Longimicrobiales bacterium]